MQEEKFIASEITISSQNYRSFTIEPQHSSLEPPLLMRGTCQIEESAAAVEVEQTAKGIKAIADVDLAPLQLKKEKLWQALPLPVYVDPFTSFVTYRSPTDVMDHLCTLFDRQGVDYQCSRHHRAKIDGIVYDQHVACVFKVFVFERDAASYLVEFQRRSGPVVAFNRLYQQWIRELSTDSSTFTLPKQRVDLDIPTRDALLEMLSSSYADVQKESLEQLATATQSWRNQSFLLEDSLVLNKLIARLGELLSSRNKDVVRCSCTILANLCMQEMARHIIITLVPQLAYLLGFGLLIQDIMFKEVLRQITKAFVYLTLTCKSQFVENAAIMASIEQQRKNQDVTVKTNVEQCLVQLS